MTYICLRFVSEKIQLSVLSGFIRNCHFNSINKNLVMKSQAKLFPSICLFFLSVCLTSVGQQTGQCLAVITELNGEVQFKKEAGKEFSKASWGTQLFQGDQVKTSANSEVSLLFSNSNFVTLGPNGTMTISGKKPSETEPSGNVRNISSAMMVNISALTLKKDNKKDVGALAGLRSDNTEQAIELTSPYNTLIKTNRPLFSWNAKKSFDKYNVNLYNSKGLVWSRKVSGNTMKYPENEKGLEFGESYFWNVEGEALIDNDKSTNHKFSVLTLEKSKEVGEQEAVIINTFKNEPESSNLHSVLGAYYINQGLLQDAINEFQTISKINTDATLPHEILGSLYTDVGNKDKAIEELQKALALTKNKDK